MRDAIQIDVSIESAILMLTSRECPVDNLPVEQQIDLDPLQVWYQCEYGHVWKLAHRSVGFWTPDPEDVEAKLKKYLDV